MLGKSYFLRCDGCRRTGPERPSAKEARAESRRRGWRRVPRGDESDRHGGTPGKDVCPRDECRTTNPEAK